MKKYDVLMTDEESNDIMGIADYISSELREPALALKLISRFKDAISNLEDMPQRCSLVADETLAQQGIRKVLVDNCIVFYLIGEPEGIVYVIRILYNRRDWKSII